MITVTELAKLTALSMEEVTEDVTVFGTAGHCESISYEEGYICVAYDT